VGQSSTCRKTAERMLGRSTDMSEPYRCDGVPARMGTGRTRGGRIEA
jgi:hypothetical protein